MSDGPVRAYTFVSSDSGSVTVRRPNNLASTENAPGPVKISASDESA
jgi:hypothetical protein